MRLTGRRGSIWEPVYAQIDLKKATIEIKDGGVASAQNEISVTIGEGNLTFTERRNIEYTLDRGLLDEVREGDQVPMDVSLDLVWDYITGGPGVGALPTLEDALKNTGLASAWVSTDSDACRPYAVDLVVTYLPTPSTCGDQEVITLQDYRWEEMAHDLRAGTIATSGRCNVTQAQAVRTAQP